MLTAGCGEESSKQPAPPGDEQPATADEGEPHAHAAPAELSLAPLLPLSMTAPATAEVEKAPAADARVSTPDGSFAILVDDEAIDLAARKQEIEDDTVNELQELAVDETDTIVYRTEAMPGQPEFHFVANVTAGDRALSCRDETGPFWTRAQIDLMLAACRSLAPAK